LKPVRLGELLRRGRDVHGNGREIAFGDVGQHPIGNDIADLRPAQTELARSCLHLPDTGVGGQHIGAERGPIRPGQRGSVVGDRLDGLGAVAIKLYVTVKGLGVDAGDARYFLSAAWKRSLESSRKLKN